jgi:hypothetical protein
LVLRRDGLAGPGAEPDRVIAVIAGGELTVAAVTADRANGAAFFGARP